MKFPQDTKKIYKYQQSNITCRSKFEFLLHVLQVKRFFLTIKLHVHNVIRILCVNKTFYSPLNTYSDNNEKETF